MSTPRSILRGPARPDLLRAECLADILEATASAMPDRPALRWAGRILSYRDLDRRADLVAHHLIARGAGPGAIVGLQLPRGADLLVAQAGIAKTGAAWLPLDAGAPAERVSACLADAGAIGLVGGGWDLDGLTADPDGPLRRRGPVRPDDPAYVIYTSGSTGTPKGIVVGQRAICHFLRSENDLLGIGPDDIVYQGFSAAFDMSFEEIWISYLAGASLWIAPDGVAKDPEAVAAALRDQRITVLHTVPTLLALLPGPTADLRLVNLGGEACPQALADRWADGTRRVVNTYGPTEATVSASLAELAAGREVTIGRPLPNYTLAVVDDRLAPVAIGMVGELCIGGPGVAAGYLGRPGLTAERFVANPFARDGLDRVLYRTGDLARIGADGEVRCLGRSDDQVKIRGFRVELGEIEAALCAIPGVATAAAALRHEDGAGLLAAWVVAGPGLAGPAALRTALRARLPPYMVPERIAVVPALPRLASGKVDRPALAGLALPAPPAAPAAAAPRDDAEAALHAAVARLLPGQALHPEADFFADLGGHSLLAARLVSILRADPRHRHLGVQDVYRLRTLGGIAGAMRAPAAGDAGRAGPAATPDRGRRLRCGAVQAAAVPFLVCLNVARWLAPFFVYHHLTGDPGDSIPFAIAASLAAFLVMHLAGFAVAVAGSRLLGAGIPAGRHPLWGRAYFRWWLAERLRDVAPEYLIHNSPLHPWYLRALGARIGRDTSLGSARVRAPWLLEVGDGASIGSEVQLENAHVAGGELHLGRIVIGRDACVGSYAVLGAGSGVGSDAQVDGLSAVPAGAQVSDGASVEGVPARPGAGGPPPGRPRPRQRAAWRRLAPAAYAAGAVGVAALFFLPIFPTFVLIDWLDGNVLSPSIDEHGQLLVALQYVLLAIPACAVLVALTALLCAAIRWLVLPRLAPGTYPVHGWLAWRKWMCSQIQEASLEVLHGIYATVYSPTWFRLLGAKVGRGAEISTAMGVVPDLLTLGDGCFIADGVMLGDEDVRGGWMTLRPTVVGRRSFVGNAAYVPDGTDLPDDVLIGVQTRTPGHGRMRPGDTWLGAPALRLPAREPAAGCAEALTFRPSPLRRLGRGLVEGMRIVLPLALTIGFGYAIVLDVIPQAEDGEWSLVALRLGLSGMLYGLCCLGLVAALKWIAVGIYRPAALPMWTPAVWLSEAVTNLYESVAVPNCITMLRGTPMLPWTLRLFGARIGRDAWLDTTDLTEFDCVTIGDGAELNADCGPQTHLFEDRIMKIGKVAIGAGATLHARATVLYGAEVGDRAEIGPLSLVAKGERIPAGTRWCGSPAAPWPG